MPSHLTGAYCLRLVSGNGELEEWLDLDRILVRLCESFSICTNVKWTTGMRKGKGAAEDNFGSLFPEMTKREMVTINLLA